VEFTYFQGDSGTRLLSQEIVVGKESGRPPQVLSGSLPTVTENEFLNSLDDSGKAVFSAILALAKERAMPIHWGTKGFSLNVDLDGNHVAVCYGYPNGSVYRQSVYTTMAGQGSMTSKTAVPEDVIKTLRAKAMSTGLFRPAGRDLKCPVNRTFTESEISALLTWLEDVAEAIRQYGLKQ
jgi:hypothetical protein